MTAFREEVPKETKWRERRRGVRVNSRAQLAIEWEDQDGKTFRVEAHTRIVAPYGCLVVMPQNLPLEQRLRVTNLANQQSVAAMVVWKGKQRLEGWELGIELLNPEMDFWGLQL